MRLSVMDVLNRKCEHFRNSPEVSDFVQQAFSSSSNYENVRPGYPVNAVKFFLTKLGALEREDVSKERRPYTILELGSGTGKLTRTMLEVLKGKNTRVIASDPVKSMCEQFKVVVPHTEIIQCPAEGITLPDASVDTVIAAQCFHYFANRAALKEIHRVLVPGGSLGLIWPIEDVSIPWVKDVYDFLEPVHEERSLFHPYREDWKTMFSQIADQLFSPLEENVAFKYPFATSSEEAFNYLVSCSALAGGSESNKVAFKEYFDDVMEKHFKSNGISFDHITLKVYMYWCTKES